MMVSGGQPTLVVDQTPVWWLPAVLRLPAVGDVSTVGAVDIDAQTDALIPLAPMKSPAYKSWPMPWLPISHQPQRQQADSLVPCAAMLLGYWQQPVAYDDLLKLFRIGPAGAPFRNLRYLETVACRF